MKILLLGYPDYLSNLISNLRNTPFLVENDIDIMFAKPMDIPQKFDVKLIKRLKKLTISKQILHLFHPLKSNRSPYTSTNKLYGSCAILDRSCHFLTFIEINPKK